MAVSVVSLHVYPIKGCRGTSLPAAEVTSRGIRHDRELMLVDSDGVLLSQREEPRLALFHPTLDGTTVRVTAPDGSSLVHPLGADGLRKSVRVHGNERPAVDQGDEAAAWFGERLGQPCRLVRFPPEETGWPTSDGAEIAYADSRPLLVTTVEALDDLNARLDVPLPMNRFRPNIVLAGCPEPWWEDTVCRLRIDGVELDVAKPCGRCVVTTVDQETAARGREPLRTLGTFRAFDWKGERGLLFGVLAVPTVTGTIRVGAAAHPLAATVNPY